jgi:hypothetical protein
MRAISIVAALVLLALTGALALIALQRVPELAAYQFELTMAAVAAAFVVSILVMAMPRPPQPAGPARPGIEAPRPAPAALATHQVEAEVIGLLGLLQEKGRLVDFLMDDITAYNDAQVGAAARVVHDGCRAALKEHVTVKPVRQEAEGTSVTVPEGYPADEYRLVGNLSGQAPFTGTLRHRGWKAERVKLPRVVRVSGDRLPAIAPAEVEVG